MAILGQNKTIVDQFLGEPEMGSILLNAPASYKESASRYRVGNYNATVGFFNEIARYLAVEKISGLHFTAGDVRGILCMVAPWAEWTANWSDGLSPAAEKEKPAADAKTDPSSGVIGTSGEVLYFSDVQRDAAKNIVAEYLAWHRSTKGYVFIYQPALAGQPPVCPDETELDKRFPST